MMIEVSNLNKRYAGKTAVSDLSFEVEQGEVVGLIGHNGAGKSTTMRILSCFMPATSGTARVAGLDVFTQADQVRRRIGYMPENNPLHPDMRVREYLKFRARLKGLSHSRSRERVDAVIAQCGLADVSKRIIGQLSKGYRQRVGLADALVHEPELIILDEPTIGLDPNQIRSVRQLIKELGAAPHRVALQPQLAGGRDDVQPGADHARRQDTGGRHAGEPAKSAGQERPRCGGDRRAAGRVEELLGTDGRSGRLQHRADGRVSTYRCSLTAAAGQDLRPRIFALVVERGWQLRELSRVRLTLEDVYIRLTRPESEEEVI